MQSKTSPRPTRPACRQCRARRVRCDRADNCCGPCSRLHLNCSYGGDAGAINVSLRSPSVSDSQDGLTQAGTRRLRIRCACEPCRAIKAKCTGGEPCQRCQRRKLQCTQPSSAVMHPQHPTPESHSSQTQVQEQSQPQGQPRYDVEDSVETHSLVNPGAAPDPIIDQSSRSLLQTYFNKAERQTRCSFLHAATVMAQFRDGSLEPALLTALRASGLRLRDSDDQAQSVSSSWMRECQGSVLAHLNQLSFQRLQALVLIIGLHLEDGNTTEAWTLLSLAARQAFALGLNHERPDLPPVTQESRRRVMWEIYLIDRVLSAGLEDFEVCPIERVVGIRLPCEDRNFEREMPSKAQFLINLGSDDLGRGDMDISAYVLRLYACRDRVLKYTKRVRREGVSPIESKDELSLLESDLEMFSTSLPKDIQLNAARIEIMTRSRDASGYIMLHTIWLQCYCDLYRFLIPGVREAVNDGAMNKTPPEYIFYCQTQCLTRAMAMCDLWTNVSTMDHLDLLDDMLLIGACIYQTANILHNLHHLPLLCQNVEQSYVLRQQLASALKMAQKSRLRRSSRMKECLREAESLIQTLGQPRRSNHFSNTTMRRGPNTNMISRGSFAPRVPSDSEESTTEAPPIGEQSGEVGALPSEAAGSQDMNDYPSLEESSSERVNLHPAMEAMQTPISFQDPSFGVSRLDFSQQPMDTVRSEHFELQLTDCYDPELGALGLYYSLN